MEKQSFDENGLQNLLNDLYNLPDPDLTEQAYAFRNHPKLWISGHFALAPHQLCYLQNMSGNSIAFLAQQGGFALEHRLSITLIKSHHAKRTGTPPKQDKWFSTKSSLKADTDGNGHIKASGTLELEITYFDPSSKSSVNP